MLHHSETECRHDLHSLNGGGADEKVTIHRRTDCFALKQAELGTSVPEVCGKQGISDATFYTWRKK
ncbi:TPA: transposase [Klebsiella aerogenes]|nr:transposase [Klebsiella aerogenes]HBT4313234.1 transposase [Klebsiella aerogenes]HDT1162130.1 transposase [Klebsiella aerogenes]